MIDSEPFDELAFLRSEVKYNEARTEALRAYAYRIEPVCRNCIHAGPLTYTGNHPYRNDWASCREGPPIAGPPDKLGAWNLHTTSNPARWPAVHHADTCGRFKLRPLLSKAPDVSVSYSETWAFQDSPTPAPSPPQAKEPG